jgi:hypothetical protein
MLDVELREPDNRIMEITEAVEDLGCRFLGGPVS